MTCLMWPYFNVSLEGHIIGQMLLSLIKHMSICNVDSKRGVISDIGSDIVLVEMECQNIGADVQYIIIRCLIIQCGRCRVRIN